MGLPHKTIRRQYTMKIERIFNNQSSVTFKDIFQSIINEKIDTIVKEFYDNTDKVNSTDSSIKEEDVA